jgi:hypothetical protein
MFFSLQMQKTTDAKHTAAKIGTGAIVAFDRVDRQ